MVCPQGAPSLVGETGPGTASSTELCGQLHSSWPGWGKLQAGGDSELGLDGQVEL